MKKRVKSLKSIIDSMEQLKYEACKEWDEGISLNHFICIIDKIEDDLKALLMTK